MPAESILAELLEQNQQLRPELDGRLQAHLDQWNRNPLTSDEFDALASEFENEFKKGNSPQIESCLARAPKASRVELLELLLQVEAYQRSKRNESVDWEAYKAQFPNYLSTIEKAQKLADSSFAKIHLERTPANPEVEGESTDIFAPDTVLGKLLVNRYRLDRILGSGAFGTVYLAHDLDLNRQVAIKLQKRKDPSDRSNEQYLSEAQFVAAMKHPHIVTVFSMERTRSGEIFIISEYIEGVTLKDRIDSGDLGYHQIAKIIASVADALHHAHQRGLIHRDIKPANILMESGTDKPYVADFGLATRDFEYLQKGYGAGSPAYKSPEQVRREGHRLDGRSDLFSLGIVMYEMLTRNRPFRGDSISEIENRIRYADPYPPCKLKAEVPPELERICLKLLRKETSERYTNGLEVVSDLKDWLSPQLQPPTQVVQEPTKITPRGLRSFSDEDAGFFLDLLPGVRDREGLPEIVSFWKKKIHQTDPEKTFSVGMMIGPSGCGKSSLVKAGIIPSLSKSIVAIHIDATTDETEARVLNALCKRLPTLRDATSLTEAMTRIRQATEPKVVIFLDQFEQWLSVRRDTNRSQLVDALRQCDGQTLQAVLMVRDDFGSATKFLTDDLGTTIDRDRNFTWVDLFEPGHARHVLIRFGQAYGKLPIQADQFTDSDHQFLDAAVQGLMQEGKEQGVVPVQLALFADMVKSKAWEPATLDSSGGARGVVLNFLEEAFSARNPQNRIHQNGARGVLKALMPALGGDIKGQQRSTQELLEVSGYADKSREFDRLIKILDSDLRLIRPSEDQEDPQGLEVGYYQLTHDYLVTSLREWLTRKQRETKKGRAELRLADRAAAWNANSENKQLPTLWEWLQIRRWTEKSKWTRAERSLMQRAGGVHLRNWGTACSILLLAGSTIGYVFQQQSLKGQQEKITVAIDSLQKTLGPAVPVNLNKLRDMKVPHLIRPEIERRYAVTTDPREKLSLAFGLAQFGKVDAQYLVSQIDTIEDRDTRNLVDALGQDRAEALAVLKKAASQCSGQEQYRRKARLALAALGIGDTELPIDACEFEGRTDHGIRTHFVDQFPGWELDRLSLIETVKNSSSPALRSAVTLGLGQTPISQISENEKDAIRELVNAWYLLPDGSTHSAVAWLMRKWELPEPQQADATKMVEGRNWFVNSQGAMFIRVTPVPAGQKKLTDPFEKIIESLSELEKLPAREQTEFWVQYNRGNDLFKLGLYEEALVAFEKLPAVVQDNTRWWSIAREHKRAFALAKLRRPEEADAAVIRWLEFNPESDLRDSTESLVALWLGRKEEAVNRLNQVLSNVDGSTGHRLYNTACLLSIFATDESATVEERQLWIDKSLTLLEGLDLSGKLNREKVVADTDLRILHSESRFINLAANLPANA
ncbi:MAG: protein kinase domain-containing protein, partial [Pirellula sp.]